MPGWQPHQNPDKGSRQQTPPGMSSITDFLPPPRRPLQRPQSGAPAGLRDRDTPSSVSGQNHHSPTTGQRNGRGPPPYGKRDGFTPKTLDDYGDGGAFPEIPIIQYPLDMGRMKSRRANSLNLQVDAEGRVHYDEIAKQGHAKDVIVYASHRDTVPVDITEKQDWSKPTEEAIAEMTERTRLALEKIVDGKVVASQPKQVVAQSSGRMKGPTIVKYTPANASAADGKQSKIIRMVEMPTDPMEPPKFKNKKIPKGPPSPPPPVMHSPPRKVSVEEQKQWNIPPCISNWKNRQGHTIPLDKRLAADGRGLQEVSINDNFAKFAEALLIADRHAREEVRLRAARQQKLAQKQKEAKEETLRKLAQKAREGRSGVSKGRGKADDETSSSDDSDSSLADHGEAVEDRERARERDRIRRDRQRQRERELRMSHMGADAKARHAKTMAERDVSEKIALGISKPSMSKEAMFDQRLFNRTEGLDSGFNDDEAYNVYDKPLFKSSNPLSGNFRPGKSGVDGDMYGPQAVSEEHIRANTDKFVADKGFAATSAAPGRPPSSSRGAGGAIQFEKSDPFGVDAFLKDAKRGRERERSNRGHHEDEADHKAKRSRP